MTKLTKRDKFALIANILNEVGADEVLVEAMDHEIELIDNRKAKGRGLTKAQKENEAFKADIVEFLTEADAEVTATDVAKVFDVNVQKATAMLKQLVDAGTVNKTAAKGKAKATFRVA